jgi:hypothetical protein
MIKNIYSGSSHVTTSGGGMSMPYMNSNYSGAGMIKYDPGQMCFQVNDGSMWHNIPNETVQVDLSYDTKQVVEWAQKKMREEKELAQLAETNETIRDLVNQLNEKKNQIEMVKTLIKKDRDLPEVQAYQTP